MLAGIIALGAALVTIAITRKQTNFAQRALVQNQIQYLRDDISNLQEAASLLQRGNVKIDDLQIAIRQIVDRSSYMTGDEVQKIIYTAIERMKNYGTAIRSLVVKCRVNIDTINYVNILVDACDDAADQTWSVRYAADDYIIAREKRAKFRSLSDTSTEQDSIEWNKLVHTASDAQNYTLNLLEIIAKTKFKIQVEINAINKRLVEYERFVGI